VPFSIVIMDIARENVAAQKRRRRMLYALAGVVVLVLGTVGISKLKPAAPGVERGTAWIGTVKRGPMVRQVRGLGTLVPTDIRWIPAQTDGRVESVPVLPGAKVKKDTILLVLSNPQLEQETMNAKFALSAAEADQKNLEAQMNNAVMAQRSTAAQVASDYAIAQQKADADSELYKSNVVAKITMENSKGVAEQLKTRAGLEQERVAAARQTMKAQIDAGQAKVQQAAEFYKLKLQQEEALKVRAGQDGVLQESALKPGQFVTTGTMLAKVVDPGKLKAELKIPETQAKDLGLNQPAQIDTHNGIIAGTVMRIDPAAVNGTVTVDVSLEGSAPGMRPDLSVDGTIDLERMANVLYVERPAFGQEHSTVGMFKVEADNTHADRVQVKFGRSSPTVIEIVDGLREGDQVILSDMSRVDNFDRIKLE
jgi:HlyD family secretion protein